MANKLSDCTEKHIAPALHQEQQFVIPELILDAYRQNEEENAKKHEAEKVFSHQVPGEWALKEIFTCNHKARQIHWSQEIVEKCSTCTTVTGLSFTVYISVTTSYLVCLNCDS